MPERDNLVKAIGVLLFVTLLAGCGSGSGERGASVPLPIDASSASAYTVDYLNSHPELLVQPEHLIVVTIRPARPYGDLQSARLHVREPMTLAIESSAAALALSAVTIESDDGHEKLSHRPHEAAASLSFEPGSYRILFRGNPGLAEPTTLFLKLADTVEQSASKRPESRAARKLNTKSDQTRDPTPLGAVDSSCIGCSFDNADLSHQDFTRSTLHESTFRSTTFNWTDMQGVQCELCQFAPKGVPIATSFIDANLSLATLSGPFIGVNFAGASLWGASLVGDFRGADFRSSTTRATGLQYADLTQATLWNAKIAQADFSNASFTSIANLYQYGIGGLGNSALRGARFDNVKPSNLWTTISFAGMDLTDASFAGMDLSHADLSVSSGTKITAEGLSQAILSNGVSGVNLSGQSFVNFTGWAASADGTGTGADLRGVDLSGANLYRADLTKADLSRAVLVGSDLSNTSLKGAKLLGAQLGTDPDSASASAANLSGAYLPQADFSDADLRSVKLDNVRAYGNVKFVRARLDSASLTGAVLADADFTGASLAVANLTQAFLINATLSSAMLQNAVMVRAYLQGASFFGTVSVSGLSLVDAYVATTAGSWSFTEQDGTPFVYGYGATELGDLLSTSKGVAECPSGEQSPCTGSRLLPSASTPYPPPPPGCIALPPDYDNCPIPS